VTSAESIIAKKEERKQTTHAVTVTSPPIINDICVFVSSATPFLNVVEPTHIQNFFEVFTYTLLLVGL